MVRFIDSNTAPAQWPMPGYTNKKMLFAQGLNKYYGTLQVLQDIDLTVAKGEVVAIMGASGAGKSTLLHVLATLERPDSGILQLDGTDLLTLQGKKLAAFRNNAIGFVFQLYNLLPEFTTLENVCMPGYIRGDDKSVVEAKGKSLLALLNLSDRSQHKPAALSGGEQQRVAVARALINSPRIVFADEPSGNLDSKNAAALHALFFELRDKMGQTFVLATHDQALANMTDRQLYIRDGKLATKSISSHAIVL
jgi:lipoprotein-releasing system ATP-binding protein